MKNMWGGSWFWFWQFHRALIYKYCCVVSMNGICWKKLKNQIELFAENLITDPLKNTEVSSSPSDVLKYIILKTPLSLKYNLWWYLMFCKNMIFRCASISWTYIECSLSRSLIFFGLQITSESIIENVTGVCSSVSVNASNVKCKM